MGVLRDRFGRGEFVCILDVTPPRGTRSDLLLRRASVLDGAEHAIGVIADASCQTSLDGALELSGSGSDTLWHLACRGLDAAQVEQELIRAEQLGLDQLLVVPGFARAPGVDPLDAFEWASEHLSGGLVGLGYDQECRGAALLERARKRGLEPDFIQTRPFLDWASYSATVHGLRRDWPDTRIVAGVMHARVEETDGAALPDGSASRPGWGDEEAVGRVASEGCWDDFEERVAQCVDSPSIDGVAICTAQPDLSPEEERSCRHAVGAALAGVALG